MQYLRGQRYVDDLICHRQDADKSGAYEETCHHLTDAIFSTRAIIDDAANLKERVTYDAYGNARHHRRAELLRCVSHYGYYLEKTSFRFTLSCGQSLR